MKLNLVNNQVVVVGGTNGIGLSISKGFLSEGAIVHVISRKKK
jgi:NAD(P)-dependent dehydrogenase (short-subunit alcohol dehydrogenase family)